MSQAALDYINNLLKEGKKPQDIKSQLVSAGWDPTVVDDFLNQLRINTLPKIKAKPKKSRFFVIVLGLILVPSLFYLGYLLYVRQINSTFTPASDQPEPTPQLSSSPSALLVPPDSEKISIGISKLFTPPEFSYIATLSASLNNCTVELKFDSKTATNSSYFKSQTTPSTTNCSISQTTPGFQEYFKLTQDSLLRSNPAQKFRRLSKNPNLTPPNNSDPLVKSLFPPGADWQIMASREVAEGTELKTSVSSPSLSGTYLLTIRPAGYQIVSAVIDATLQQNTTQTKYSGTLLFRNRAMITQPTESEIEP